MKRNKSSLFICLAAAFALSASAEDTNNDGSKSDNFGSILEMAGVKNDVPLLQASKGFKDKNVRVKKRKRHVSMRQCLWEAALRVSSEKSIVVSDFKGGVLSTDWFGDVATINEREKWNIVIHPGKPQPSVSVAVFKQVRTNGEWRDAGLNAKAASELQSKITNECNKLQEPQDE